MLLQGNFSLWRPTTTRAQHQRQPSVDHHQPDPQADNQEAQESSNTTQRSDPNRSMQSDLISLYHCLAGSLILHIKLPGKRVSHFCVLRKCSAKSSALSKVLNLIDLSRVLNLIPLLNSPQSACQQILI